jgi:hypothetical protein
MNSLTETKEPTRNGRKSGILLVVGALVLAIVASLGVVVWQRYGVHNIFDAVMDAEWRYTEIQRTNPLMRNKYEVKLRYCDDPMMARRKELEYWPRDEGVVFSIFPAMEEIIEDECGTTWMKARRPVTMSMGISEAMSDNTLYILFIEHDRNPRALNEWVEVHEHGRVVSDARAVDIFSELGFSGDYLRAKRDWVILEEVLPDLLVANPGVKYTVEDWGRVTVTTDRHLS